MGNALLRRVLFAAVAAVLISLWCWLIAAFHAAWSFGIVEGYLEGGRVPLYPTIPVTYGEFFFFTVIAPMLTFVLALIWGSIAPQRYNLIGFFVCWLIGFWAGAENVSFTFQIDYGTSWGPTEALRALFFHPLVTPFAIVFGLAGTATLTRPLRKP